MTNLEAEKPKVISARKLVVSVERNGVEAAAVIPSTTHSKAGEKKTLGGTALKPIPIQAHGRPAVIVREARINANVCVISMLLHLRL